jgi:hypothetical protein
MNLKSLILFCLLSTSQIAIGQFGYGFTASTDIYHRYTNPEDGVTSRSAGSVLLNLGIGPKLWFGNKKASLSLESQAVIGILGLSLSEYKGMGTVAFPILAKINFKGLSSFDREGKLGFSIGGGIQYSKTELYGLTEEYKNISRSLFKTYIVQAGYGFGLSGFTLGGFARYGFNNDSKANIFSIGLQYDFNIPMLRKITNPESEL